MAKILAVEDSQEYQLTIRASLEPDHQVIFFSDSDHVVERVIDLQPELILMDIGLPEGNGKVACQELQRSDKTNKIPLLFVTGCRSPADIAEGLFLGADDYITKPFNPLELRARCESRIKKSLDRLQKESLIKVDSLVLNLLKRQASLLPTDGSTEKKIQLTPGEFQLLHYLIINLDRVVTRDEISTRLFGHQELKIGSRVIDTQIKSLRKKSDYISNRIKSVYGKGYQFVSATYEQVNRS